MNDDESAARAINAVLERASYMEYRALETRMLRMLQNDIESFLSERDKALTEIVSQRQKLQKMIAELTNLDVQLEKETDIIYARFETQVADLQSKYTEHLKKEKARIKKATNKWA